MPVFVISDAKMVLTAVKQIEKLALARHKSFNVFPFKLYNYTYSSQL